MNNNNIRFELSFKNIFQLEKKLNFCRSNNIKNINIPCKGVIKKELFNSTINHISKNLHEFNVTYHYSLYHHSKNKKTSYQDFLDFVKIPIIEIMKFFLCQDQIEKKTLIQLMH